MTLAMYPLNRVYLSWVLLIRGGSVSCKAWIIIGVWFLFDVWGAFSGTGQIDYWAHLGGFLGGPGLGLPGLRPGWFQLKEYDNRSLLDIIRGNPKG